MPLGNYFNLYVYFTFWDRIYVVQKDLKFICSESWPWYPNTAAFLPSKYWGYRYKVCVTKPGLLFLKISALERHISAGREVSEYKTSLVYISPSELYSETLS